MSGSRNPSLIFTARCATPISRDAPRRSENSAAFILAKAKGRWSKTIGPLLFCRRHARAAAEDPASSSSLRQQPDQIQLGKRFGQQIGVVPVPLFFEQRFKPA